MKVRAAIQRTLIFPTMDETLPRDLVGALIALSDSAPRARRIRANVFLMSVSMLGV